MTNSEQNKGYWSTQQVYTHLQNQQNRKIPFSLPEDVYCTVDFKWNEVLLTKDKFFQMPSMEILDNLNELMSVVQRYRTLLGKKIRINSSWRTKAKQDDLFRQYKQGLLGNEPSKTSLHLEGLAIDISVVDGSDKELQKLVNDTFAGEAEFGGDYTHIGLTTFSKNYLQRHGLFREDIYRKLVLDTTKLPKTQRNYIEKRINPANWNIQYNSTFDPIKNKEMFYELEQKSNIKSDNKNINSQKDLNFSEIIKELPKYFDTEKIINKYSKDFGKKIKGTDTGLAADLFSEEEIEELKERMKHERLPQETLKKMGEYHRRKFNERIKSAMTYEGDGSDITIANFVDKEGNFTFIPQKVEPTKPHPPVRNSKNSTSKGLSKDEKWQSFRKLLRTFFAIPDDDGKPMGKINSADVYNAIDVMETMKKAMHESDVTQITDPKNSIKDSMQFEFLSDDVQTDMMQSVLSQTSEQIKSDIKTEILDEISRQTMFPDREHVENIMRDVFDSVAYRRGYKISN